MPTVAPVPIAEPDEPPSEPDWPLDDDAEPAPDDDEAVGGDAPELPCDPGAALPVEIAVAVSVVAEVPAAPPVCAESSPPLASAPATGVGVPVGLCPGNHEIVSPSPDGSDATLASTVAS